jgi:predicted ATPase
MIEELFIQLQELCSQHGCQLQYYYDGCYPKQRHHVILRYPVTYMSSPYESESGNDLAECLKTVLEKAQATTFTTKQ